MVIIGTSFTTYHPRIYSLDNVSSRFASVDFYSYIISSCDRFFCSESQREGYLEMGETSGGRKQNIGDPDESRKRLRGPSGSLQVSFECEIHSSLTHSFCTKKVQNTPYLKSHNLKELLSFGSHFFFLKFLLSANPELLDIFFTI
jgi:hypothetical protein